MLYILKRLEIKQRLRNLYLIPFSNILDKFYFKVNYFSKQQFQDFLFFRECFFHFFVFNTVFILCRFMKIFTFYYFRLVSLLKVFNFNRLVKHFIRFWSLGKRRSKIKLTATYCPFNLHKNSIILNTALLKTFNGGSLR